MIEIPLTQGRMTQVDDKFEFLNQYRWYALKYTTINRVRYYAARNIHLNGIHTTIRMHRIIMETEVGRSLLKTEEIDHLDHDGLRNTLDNLRIATKQQNQMNRQKTNIETSSQFKGVFWRKNRSIWTARIKNDGKYIYLGSFDIESEAARAYDTAAKLYFGEYAQLNLSEEYENPR